MVEQQRMTPTHRLEQALAWCSHCVTTAPDDADPGAWAQDHHETTGHRTAVREKHLWTYGGQS